MKSKFSNWEAVCILANAMLWHCETGLAGGVFAEAGSGGALSSVIAATLALLIIYTLLTLYQKRFCGVSLLNVFSATPAHILISIAAAAALFLSAIGALCAFAPLIKEIDYPNTPIWYIFMFLAAAALAGGLSKKRSIASAGAILFPVIAAALALLCLSALPHSDFYNLFPLLGRGGGAVLRGTLRSLSLYADALLIFLVAEDLSEPRALRMVGMTAAGVAAAANAAVALCFQLITRSMSNLTAPIYALTEAASYGRFFRHPSALFIIFLAASGILYGATALHYAVRAAKNLKVKEAAKN